jgi:carbamate kinase
VIVVVALGGNALLRRHERPEIDRQRGNAAVAAATVAEVARHHEVVVTHGNGPQVGLLALQSETYRSVGSYPLDVIGAESEGMIGYLLQQELHNALPNRNVATLLTQVVVDAHDPAFDHPTKPIGGLYTAREAERLAHDRGWAITSDGASWRRVVPSPQPQSIVELHTIELLLGAGVVVVCAGGGGIPVVVTEGGMLRGVEAVIDKDRAAALLACQLDADMLLLLTDVEGAFVDWGTPNAKVVRRAHPDAIRTLAFPDGSMGPKVEAAAQFAASTGGLGAIGALEDATAILRGDAGTTICHSARGLELASLNTT